MVGLCYLGTVQQTQVGIQSFQGVFFMLITENFFTPMYSVMNQLPEKLPLFRREYISGLYDSPTFYIANIVSFVSILLNDVHRAKYAATAMLFINLLLFFFTIFFLSLFFLYCAPTDPHVDHRAHGIHDNHLLYGSLAK